MLKIPLLIVPPWINKFYILDLNEKKSMVRYLLKQGAGTLTISGSNSYVGPTTIQAGTLSIVTTNALPGWDTAGRYAVSNGAGLAGTVEAVSLTGTGSLIAATGVQSYLEPASGPHNVVIGTTGELGIIGLIVLALFLLPLILRRGWGP